jgi:hypothetical protein
MLWSLLLPLVPSRAADLPAVRASYNTIGGVFTPLWVAHENKLFGRVRLETQEKHSGPFRRSALSIPSS